MRRLFLHRQEGKDGFDEHLRYGSCWGLLAIVSRSSGWLENDKVNDFGRVVFCENCVGGERRRDETSLQQTLLKKK